MKKYKYNGKIYSEEDLSEEIGEEYGGDLYWLYSELQADGKASEQTLYSAPSCPEKVYDDYETLIEDQFDYLQVDESEVKFIQECNYEEAEE